MVHQDIDISQYYMYDRIFTATGAYWGWNEGANTMQTTISQQGANSQLGFVRRREFRVGLDASLWHGLVSVDANFFVTNTDGLVTKASNSHPVYYKIYYPTRSFLPYENYNNQRRTGYDITANVQWSMFNVQWNLGLTGMGYTSRNTRVSENVEYDWLRAEGQPTDTLWGYRCLGFFQDEQEVAASAVINSNTRPGDLKYADLNGDGIIDAKDMTVLGHWSASFYAGLNLTAKWRQWTLYLNGTGSFGGKALRSSTYDWVYGDRKYSEVVLGRWTPATAATTTYPRLTTEGGDLNFVNSDFWLYSTSAFTLNRVQLTYDFPSAVLGSGFVKGLSLYLSGSSLLTIARERRYMETAVGAAPYCRAYTLGAKITF